MSPSLIAWISPLSLLVVALLVWFFRHRIQRWATKGVEHYYDSKLEELRSSLRNSEEEMKSALQRKDRELEALRSPAMQTLVARRNTLAQKKIEAYDLLWDSIYKMHAYKLAARFMQKINIDEVFKTELLDEKLKKFFSQMFSITNIEKMPITEQHRARPYVSHMCWAKFAAYSAIGSHAAALLIMFRTGYAKQELLNEGELKTLVSIALPHHIPLLEKEGVTASFFLMDELENDILAEIQRGLYGATAEEDVALAKKIIDASNELDFSSQENSAIPSSIDD